MKEVIKLWKDWHNVVLFAMMTVTLVLLLADCDTMAAMVMSKVSGLVLLGCTIALTLCWHGEGLLRSIDEFCEE